MNINDLEELHKQGINDDEFRRELIRRILEEDENEMKNLKCQNCHHRWVYKGKSAYCAFCPVCHHTVSLPA